MIEQSSRLNKLEKLRFKVDALDRNDPDRPKKEKKMEASKEKFQLITDFINIDGIELCLISSLNLIYIPTF